LGSTFFFVIALFYCLTAKAEDFENLLKTENLRQSWIKAVVYEPDSIFSKSIDFLKAKTRGATEQVLLSGQGHDTSLSTEAKLAVKKFLQSQERYTKTTFG